MAGLIESQNHALALVHIGMMIAVHRDWEYLPTSTNELNNILLKDFGIDMWTEPDIFVARDKLTAMVEERGELN